MTKNKELYTLLCTRHLTLKFWLTDRKGLLKPFEHLKMERKNGSNRYYASKAMH